MVLFLLGLTAALAADGYEEPPAEIAAILDAPSSPAVDFSPDGAWFIEKARPSLRSLEELAAKRVKVAGITLDPSTFGPSRPYLYRQLSLRRVDAPRDAIDIALPEGARISHVMWHADSDKVAFTLTVEGGIELWVATVPDGAATRRRDSRR